MVLVGTLGEDTESVYDIGVDAIVSILPEPLTLAEAVDDAEALVVDATERTLRLLLVGVALGS